jgi:putative hydrolase of the HAD superfamily
MPDDPQTDQERVRMIDVDYVVWDFDGVLNANIVDGRFIWADHFERDIGLSLESFSRAIFNEEFDSILRGDKDLLDHVSAWSTAMGCARPPESILRYWFESDSHIDLEMLEILQRVAAAGGKNIIATNNDPRRTLFIENEMELGARVARIFSSGRMGCLKPEAEFFGRVTDELGVSADRVILIDDNLPNLRAARDLGWQTHHFSGDYASLKARLGLG